MSKIIICYNWRFTLDVLNRSGRNYKNHNEVVLGLDYGLAKFDMERRLKKKNWVLRKTKAVKVLEVAFAYYKDSYERVPRENFAELPLPVIPSVL